MKQNGLTKQEQKDMRSLAIVSAITFTFIIINVARVLLNF